MKVRQRSHVIKKVKTDTNHFLFSILMPILADIEYRPMTLDIHNIFFILRSKIQIVFSKKDKKYFNKWKT